MTVQGTEPAGLFARPTSVFLCGSSRALLNWVAYALTASNPGGVVWTDVQLEGEVREDSDFLSTTFLRPDRFFAVFPHELMRNDFAGNLALGGLVRSDRPGDAVERFADFLRLPAHTRAVISRLPQSGPPVVLVLSNGHRTVALFPTETVAPTVRAIVESGASLLMTWADAAPMGRFAFEHILHVSGGTPATWEDAVLRVELGSSTGPLRTGAELCLKEYPPVATFLRQAL